MTVPARFGPFHVGAEIGVGASARVYRCTGDDGAPYVAKVYGDGGARGAAREYMALRRLDHANVVRAVAFFPPCAVTPVGACLVMAYGGECLFHTITRGGYDAASIARQLCCAVAHMHERDVYHRDIKLENAAYDARTGALVVLDVGLACTSDTYDATSVVGSPPYLAPEVLRASGQGPGPADVWSLGVCLYMIHCQHPPFATASPERCQHFAAYVAHADRSVFRWSWAAFQISRPMPHPELVALVDAMLALDARERPSMPAVVRRIDGAVAARDA